ncbi:hypothetical protein PR048_023267 [Dryococelus australis]|uniref:Uncharacterized protein n=1 Tax=Dryococelus australis TaxID=614101 RepID=A0ABQ9GTL3_9NEOP|nr:hypothetical protein PR048_023267 [Dryococelus australis]
MLQHVENKIIAELKASKYCAISVDSSAGVTHYDRLAFIVRIVSESSNPVEIFGLFIPQTGHSDHIQSAGTFLVMCSTFFDTSRSVSCFMLLKNYRLLYARSESVCFLHEIKTRNVEIKLLLKALLTTQLSARYDACRALTTSYPCISFSGHKDCQQPLWKTGNTS